ncbi:hypothetical protein [Christiangramia sp. SM2212]|uniref:Uncharacterized protein n=1 Tax=Christiangramia sediminicola TaxID=3073267 RepID=A0ABU1EPT5_9FLAO|nr:hypothetical protein [Christiangramia sp. SM2212]MDR5590395.1 hypothetical protein [Christiangramia sp. SM2212]
MTTTPSMRLKNRQSTKGSSEFLLTGSIIAICIAFSPYLFYSYEIFPSGPVWETSFFSYESKYYKDVLTAAWTYTSKLVPFLLLLIWFFTCKHWWYHVILIPMIMYAYQLISVFYDDVYLNGEFFMDINGLIYLAPFFIAILSIVYLIRIKIFDRVYGLDLSELDETEISVFSPVSDKDLKEIKEFQYDEDSEEYEESNVLIEDYYRKL